jgi:tight adherence protein B
MWLTVMLATIAALGVLVAGIAAAMPTAEPPGIGPAAGSLRGRWDSGSLRSRIYSPFEAIATRSGRRRRLTGGLTLAEQLARADLKFRTSEFVMIQVGFLIGGAAISLLRFGFGPQFVIAGVAAYLVPMRYVKFRQRRRLKAFNRQLPDTLSLLSNGLKSGYSLPQALDSVSRNTAAPIGDELSRSIREMNLGSTTEQALTKMVRRVGSEDFDLIVTAITIHGSVGGNLAGILESISHTIRQRIHIKSQISALTAQARASGWVITLLPFVVAGILYFLTPGYFRVMLHERAGQELLVLAGLSIVVGNAIVRRIVNFRV